MRILTKSLLTAMWLTAVVVSGLPGRAADVITFDDLSSPPAPGAATGLWFANNASSSYGGVLWDPRTVVVHKDYRVDTGTPGPLFGLPHSGDYFITNESTDGGDQFTLQTTRVLTGAWFGRNEYYGYGAGADQITIYALQGATPLASVAFNLPENNPGQPEPLSFVDTSAFLALTGITGYRIDRHELGTQSGNWVADSFEFEPVPEPSAAASLGSILLVAAAARLRRQRL